MLSKFATILLALAPSALAYGTGFTNKKVVSGFYPSYALAPAVSFSTFFSDFSLSHACEEEFR
jgi:hypothetical protein